VYLLGDDTLARKAGKCVSLAAMHHDPLLSTARKPFFSFGHVWVVLALWVPLPMGRGRGFALPLLVRLYTGAKRGGRTDAPSRPATGQRRRAAEAAHAARDRRTKLELLRELVGLVAGWAPARRCYLAVDSAYAGRALLEHRPPNVEVVSRLRLDAALWAPAPKRRPGQKGRPRRRGARLPTPQQVAARCRHWHTLTVTIYGRTVTTQVRSMHALCTLPCARSRCKSCSSATPRASDGTKPSSAPTRRPTPGSSWKRMRAAGAWRSHSMTPNSSWASPSRSAKARGRSSGRPPLPCSSMTWWCSGSRRTRTPRPGRLGWSDPGIVGRSPHPLWTCSPPYGAPWSLPAFWRQRVPHPGSQIRQLHRQTALSTRPNGGSRD